LKLKSKKKTSINKYYGFLLSASTGMVATSSIQLKIQSVMWGMTYTVLPKYNPYLSYSITF